MTHRPVQVFREKTKVEVHDDDDSGCLVCSCAGFAPGRWCRHIQRVVADEADAASLRMLCNAVVPIIPSEDFWIHVTLGDATEGFRSVKVMSGRAGGSHPIACPVDDLVGYLAEGEGRITLREMLFEWLRGQYRTVPPCKSKLHKKVQWSKADRRENRDFNTFDWISLWTLLSAAKCYDCLTFSTDDLEQDAPVLSSWIPPLMPNSLRSSLPKGITIHYGH